MSYGGKYVQGKFRLEHPEKYIGDPNNVIFRSSWERIVMNHFDSNDSILRWQSEELHIPYRSPVDRRIHRYMVDFTFWANTKDGLKKFLVEVKPKKETVEPKKRPTESEASFQERVKTFLVNRAKWKAAVEYAAAEGSQFIVLTEDQIMPSQNSIKPYRQPKPKGVANGKPIKSRRSKK